MYEILHDRTALEELEFYLSYADKDKKILEPLCGSGRFLLPFMEQELCITGLDASEEMLGKLKSKAPAAHVIQADIAAYQTEEKYDYIFIPSGSVSLFTDMGLCKRVLHRWKEMMAPGGKLVFSVDTVANRCPDSGYETAASVKTKDGLDLILKNKNHYDEKT